MTLALIPFPSLTHRSRSGISLNISSLPSQIRIQGMPQRLLKSCFTVGIWERPTGCFGHHLIALIHGGESSGKGLLGPCLSSGKVSEPPEGPESAGTSGRRNPGGHTPVCGGVSAPANKAVQLLDWTVGSRWGAQPGPRLQLAQPAVRIGKAPATVTLDFTGLDRSHGASVPSEQARDAASPSIRDIEVAGSSSPSPDVDSETALGAVAPNTVSPNAAAPNTSCLGAGGMDVEGDLKFQLFSGHRRDGHAVFMHRSSCFYTWLSTHGSVPGQVVNLAALDKLSGGMKGRGAALSVHWV